MFTQKPVALAVLGEGRRRGLVDHEGRKRDSSARIIFFVLLVFIELFS